MSEQKHTPEPFGYFKAEPFGWTDCAETEEGAVPLYEQSVVEDLKESDALIDRLAALLSDTAIALKGEAAELQLHSWHDLPVVALAAMIEIEMLKGQRDELLAALSVARARVELDREALFDCHKDFSTNTVTDDLGKSGLDEYDAVLHTIDDAIACAKRATP